MLISAILNWMAGFIGKEIKDKQQEAANEAKTAAVNASQKAAVTPGEIDDASKKVAGGF